MTISDPLITTPVAAVDAMLGMTPIGNPPGPVMELVDENNFDGPIVVSWVSDVSDIAVAPAVE